MDRNMQHDIRVLCRTGIACGCLFMIEPVSSFYFMQPRCSSPRTKEHTLPICASPLLRLFAQVFPVVCLLHVPQLNSITHVKPPETAGSPCNCSMQDTCWCLCTILLTDDEQLFIWTPCACN